MLPQFLRRAANVWWHFTGPRDTSKGLDTAQPHRRETFSAQAVICDALRRRDQASSGQPSAMSGDAKPAHTFMPTITSVLYLRADMLTFLRPNLVHGSDFVQGRLLRPHRSRRSAATERFSARGAGLLRVPVSNPPGAIWRSSAGRVSDLRLTAGVAGHSRNFWSLAFIIDPSSS